MMKWKVTQKDSTVKITIDNIVVENIQPYDADRFAIALQMAAKKAVEYSMTTPLPSSLSTMQPEIVKVLERAKHEHYDGSYEGLNGCNAIGGRSECDCGADEMNAEIDELIEKLQSID